jgi:hypothetical protein
VRKILAAAIAVAITAGGAAAAPASAKTSWLCKPGQRNNPCTPSLTTTHVSPTGEVGRVERVRRPSRPEVDCFYVYPTVSDDETPLANRTIDPEMRSIALFQAARYSSECKVYAPVYRQFTLRTIGNQSAVPADQRGIPYADVRSAWREYLSRFNKGRGVILIGHSQGTFHLRRLVAEEIDRKPSVRRRLIAAYLLGGNVLVERGEDAGGDFRNVPACRSNTQLGCVVAYSIYGGPPPENSLFGRTAESNREVLCNNPASLRGGSANIDPIQPTEPYAPGTTIGAAVAAVGSVTPDVSTPWFEADNSYRARCVSQNGANVLQVTPRGGAPALRAIPTAEWGLHLADANLPLGNLIDLAKKQIAVYERESEAE